MTVLTIEHHWTNIEGPVLDYLADVAGLFLQFAHGARLWRLVCIHQASGNLDDGGVDRRTPLLLEHNARLIVWLGWVLENGCHTNAVNVGTSRPCETFGRLPCAFNAVRIGVCCSGDGLILRDDYRQRGVRASGSALWLLTYLTRVAHLASLYS